MSRVAVRDLKAALNLVGATANASLANNAANNVVGNKLSMNVWVYKDSNSDNFSFISKDGTTTGYNLTTLFNSCVLFYTNIQGGGGYDYAQTSSYIIPLRRWTMITAIYDGANRRIYVNTNLVKTDAKTGNISSSAGSSVSFGNTSTNAPRKLSQAQVWDRDISIKEMEALYAGGVVPGAVVDVPFDEGANVPVDRASGNALTLGTGATFTFDTPMKKRQNLGDNLVPNGDFSLVPPFVAATNAQSRVIDGSAAGAPAQIAGLGSTYGMPTEAKKIFRWNMNAYVVTSPSVQYDTVTKRSGVASIRLQGTQIKERVNITLGNRNFADLNDPVDIRNNLIPIRPNTTYKYSVWMKQDASNVVGAPQGIRALFWQHSGTGVTGGATVAAPPNPDQTFDWVKVEGTITTTATAQFLNIYGTISGNGTNYYDATGWFDEFELREVVTVGRPIIRDLRASLTVGAARSADGLVDLTATDVTMVCSVKINAYNGNSIMGFYGPGGTPDSLRLNIEPTGYPFLFGVNPTPVGSVLTKPSLISPKNNWSRWAFTYNKTSGLARLYLDGRLIGSGTYIVRPSSTAQFFNAVGPISNAKLYKWEFTPEEIAKEFSSNYVKDATFHWRLDEGSGGIANDTSAGGLNPGVYTGGSIFMAESSNKGRMLVNPNLVPNGNFAFAPPFTADQNISSRWIDGTSGGSTTNDLYRWWFTSTGGGQTARFENGAIRIDSPVAGGGTTGQVVSLITPVSPSTDSQRKYMIPVLPSTSYTVRARVKTDNISNVNAGGAKVRVLHYSGAATASLTANESAYIRGTNDWQEITFTFTSNVNARFFNIWLQLFNETGVAWFDDIRVEPTTPVTRPLA